MYSSSEQRQEQLGHAKAQQAAAGERTDPREHQILDHVPIDVAKPPRCAHAHDRRCLGVRGAHRNPRHRGEQQAQRGGQIRRKSLIGLELYHVHAHGLDDPVAADGCAQAHDHRAQRHQPHGHHKAGCIRRAAGKGRAQQKDGHEFLPILRAVHKGHGGAAGHLRPGKKALCFDPVEAAAQKRGEARHDKTQQKAKQRGEQQPVEDLDPLRAVDAGKTILDGDRRTGQARDQRMALAGGNSKVPRRSRPDDNGGHGRAQGDEGQARVSAEIHHVVNRHRDRGVERCHDEHTQKVARGRHQDGLAHIDGACGYAGGDGVGRIRPSVDQDDAQRQNRGDKQHGVARHLPYKIKHAHEPTSKCTRIKDVWQPT